MKHCFGVLMCIWLLYVKVISCLTLVIMQMCPTNFEVLANECHIGYHWSQPSVSHSFLANTTRRA